MATEARAAKQEKASGEGRVSRSAKSVWAAETRLFLLEWCRGGRSAERVERDGPSRGLPKIRGRLSRRLKPVLLRVAEKVPSARSKLYFYPQQRLTLAVLIQITGFPPFVLLSLTCVSLVILWPCRNYQFCGLCSFSSIPWLQYKLLSPEDSR